MLTAWLLFTLAVSFVVAAGARLLEGAMAEWDVATRWVWALGIGLAAALAALPLLPSGPSLASIIPTALASVEVGPVSTIAVPGVLVGAAIPSVVPAAVAGGIGWLDPIVAVLWGAASALLLVRMLGSWRRMAGVRRACRRHPLPEGEVLVSREIGPAVFGLFRNQVVIPEWCLHLPAEERGLILAHEEEHRRTRDTLLVAASGLAVVALPWNAAIWWMWARLRGAVEVDCDARVTRLRPESRHRYGHLLLLVGSRSSAMNAPLATFSRKASSLRRRIRHLTRERSSLSTPRALLLASGGILLVAAACLIPGPDRDTSPTGPELESANAVQEPADDVGASPRFTPHDVRPHIVNREHVAVRLQEAYPPELREAGVGGTVLVHLFLDESGDVRNVEMAESSGHADLDRAAMSVAREFEFSPALNRDQPVPVWIQVPVTFRASGAAEATDASEPERTRETRAARGSSDSTADSEGPTFTPHDTAPRISNPEAVGRALETEYPAELRDAGVAGTVILHLRVDEEGVVRATEIAEGSGHEALDEAARNVATRMEFTPALNRGEEVPVWIQLPVSFRARE